MVAGAAVVLERQPGQPVDQQLVRAGGGADQPLLVGAQGQAVRVADGLALRVEGDGLAPGRAVEPDAGDAAGQHPAQADVARRDRVVAVDHPREVDVLAVGRDVHLARGSGR